MNERSYIRQKPLWLQYLNIRREREAYEAARAQTFGQMQARNECEFGRGVTNQANELGVIGQWGNT